MANQLINTINEMANDNNLTASNNKITQNLRNPYKVKFIDAMEGLLRDMLANEGNVEVYRTKDGVVLMVDNDKIGMIPITISPMIKDLDYDPIFEEENYLAEQRAKAAKKAEAEALKAERIRKAQEARARKLAEKEARKAELEAGDTDDNF